MRLRAFRKFAATCAALRKARSVSLRIKSSKNSPAAVLLELRLCYQPEAVLDCSRRFRILVHDTVRNDVRGP
jgi:hypothetical protein